MGKEAFGGEEGGGLWLSFCDVGSKPSVLPASLREDLAPLIVLESLGPFQSQHAECTTV